jgi:hypothetical protein
MVSFRSNRDMWFVVLVCAALISESFRAEEQTTVPAQIPWGLQYAAVFVISVAAAFGYAANVGLGPENLISGIDTFYPVRATEYVRDQQLPGPMYNSFDWGGFLIFNLRDYPVSIDGRNDFYGPQIFSRSKNTLQGIGWKSDPDLARANFVLIEREQPLAKILKADTDFKLVYVDKLAAIFVRQNPAPKK